MAMLRKILAGSAGLAMIAGAAAPAAAQYNQYPNQGYGQQGGVIGQVLDSVLGQGRYGAYGQGPDRMGVDQCARAAEARVSGDFRAGRYGYYNQGYNDRRYGNRYGNGGYNNAVTNARVVGITDVQRRNSGLRVRGVIDSGMGFGQGYGHGYGNQAYDPRYNDPRNNDPRYNQGYGNPGYGNQAFGHNAHSADLRFDCRVDFRGRVLSLDIKRNNGRRG
jgi:hypothetical protein